MLGRSKWVSMDRLIYASLDTRGSSEAEIREFGKRTSFGMEVKEKVKVQKCLMKISWTEIDLNKIFSNLWRFK